MDETKIHIEIADTPVSLAYGLMDRKKLEWNSGMLFKFPSRREVSFWGKNTYIPLDVAFVNKDNTIFDIKQITPLSTRQVWSNGLCSMAIETNAGFFNKNNINIGHKIEIIKDSEGNDTQLAFKKC